MAMEHTVIAQGPYNLKNPFAAKLKDRWSLNASGSKKDTQHIVIDLSGSGIQYEVGDALGVIPRNEVSLVQAIIDHLGLTGDEAVESAKQGPMTLRELLNTHEITRVPKTLLPAAIEVATDEALIGLDIKDKEALTEYTHGRDLLDLLQHIHSGALDLATIVAALKPHKPRLYSIASSQNATEDEVHLTVGVQRYETYGRKRGGVASTFLGEHLDIGGSVDIYSHTSKNFRLPDHSRDVIMVGPGTGIAPFRAFLEERSRNHHGRNWLFFGDQHEQTDYLYRKEFEDLTNRGVLNRIDLAFSRDQEEKVYVQHRMLQAGDELWSWLQDGAHFYVCGDALRMAKDVDAALHEIVRTRGGLDEAGAKDYVKRLKAEKRYQRDVYAI